MRREARNQVNSFATAEARRVNNRGRQRRIPARSGQTPDHRPAVTSPSQEASCAVTGALAQAPAHAPRGPGQALRAVLILTRPEIPTERSFAGFSGTPEALAAARAGDLKLADECELAWRNAWGPKPAVKQERLPEDLRGDTEPMAFAMHRGAGPRGESLIEWGMVLPCPRCWRRLVKRPHCHKCGGSGHVSDMWASVYCDLDGNVVEID